MSTHSHLYKLAGAFMLFFALKFCCFLGSSTFQTMMTFFYNHLAHYFACFNSFSYLCSDTKRPQDLLILFPFAPHTTGLSIFGPSCLSPSSSRFLQIPFHSTQPLDLASAYLTGDKCFLVCLRFSFECGRKASEVTRWLISE
jgi:hypothetical protein